MSNDHDSSQRRRHVAKVKLTDEEYAALQTEADRTGTPVAALFRKAFFGEPGATPKPPAIALLEDALFLRVNGERPPGHPEATWRAWEREAEVFLRSLLPPDPEDEEPWCPP